MLSNLVSLFSKNLAQNQNMNVQSTRAVTSSKNPFSGASSQNVFFGAQRNNSENFGKNMPLRGGYFAGYYNNKPNIVGRRLFIEV